MHTSRMQQRQHLFSQYLLTRSFRYRILIMPSVTARNTVLNLEVDMTSRLWTNATLIAISIMHLVIALISWEKLQILFMGPNTLLKSTKYIRPLNESIISTKQIHNTNIILIFIFFFLINPLETSLMQPPIPQFRPESDV